MIRIEELAFLQQNVGSSQPNFYDNETPQAPIMSRVLTQGMDQAGPILTSIGTTLLIIGFVNPHENPNKQWTFNFGLFFLLPGLILMIVKSIRMLYRKGRASVSEAPRNTEDQETPLAVNDKPPTYQAVTVNIDDSPPDYSDKDVIKPSADQN